MIIEYSSICLSPENYRRKIDEARRLAEDAGFRFGIQIHNSIPKDFLAKLLPLREEIPLSVHSPVLASHFLNLASSDRDAAARIADGAVETLRKAGSSLFFFHGFFLTDVPIVHDMRAYRQVMCDSMGTDMAMGDSFIMRPEVFGSERFERHKEIFRENLKWLKARHPDLTIALENDFVGMGSGLPRPQELLELVDDLWFDLGHFWVSSLLHGFDYETACRELLCRKNVVGAHINHNFCTAATPRDSLQDSHGHLWKSSEQRLAPLVRLMRDKGVPLLTLEIIDGDAQDLKILLDWLQ